MNHFSCYLANKYDNANMHLNFLGHQIKKQGRKIVIFVQQCRLICVKIKKIWIFPVVNIIVRICDICNNFMMVCIGGITWTTRHSGWSLPKVLQLFSGHFVITCTFEARHLIFRCYIIDEHCDIMCDVTVPHVHWSCDLLL